MRYPQPTSTTSEVVEVLEVSCRHREHSSTPRPGVLGVRRQRERDPLADADGGGRHRVRGDVPLRRAAPGRPRHRARRARGGRARRSVRSARHVASLPVGDGPHLRPLQATCTHQPRPARPRVGGANPRQADAHRWRAARRREVLAAARGAFHHVALEHFLQTPEGRAAGELGARDSIEAHRLTPVPIPERPDTGAGCSESAAAAAIAAAMILVKDGILEHAGLLSSCTGLRRLPATSTSGRRASPQLEGRPNLVRRSCESMRVVRRVEYWRCPPRSEPRRRPDAAP